MIFWVWVTVGRPWHHVASSRILKYIQKYSKILNHKLNREEMTNNQELMHGKAPVPEVLTTYDEWEKEILKLEKGENNE